MKLYDCRVSLGANIGTINPHHELSKFSIPKAEVVLLRAIHGKDAVVDIVEVGTTDKSDMQIYQALADEFTGYPKYVHLIEKLFNTKLTDLTSDLDDLEEGLGGERIAEPVPRETIHLPKKAEIPEFTKVSRTPVSPE